MTDLSIYMTSIGNDDYQMFIKNNNSETDFIRIVIGYTEIVKGERVGKVVNSWIISPLQSYGEHVFVQSANKHMMQGKRLWVAFEALKRSKPKNTLVGSFMALSPTGSKWRNTVGSSTYFDIKAIDSLRSLEKPLEIAQIA